MQSAIERNYSGATSVKRIEKHSRIDWMQIWNFIGYSIFINYSIVKLNNVANADEQQFIQSNL